MLYIFDWDGTLMDSTGKIITSMRQASQDLGLDGLSDEAIKNIIGLGLPEAIAALYPKLSENGIGAFKRRYSAHYLSSKSGVSRLFPHVLDTLRTLKEQGHTVAIATGKSRLGLNRVLEEISMLDFFDGSRCADETASKPNPQMLTELLIAFDACVNDALMVGDTEWDMAMAKAIDMPRVAVSYGAHTRDRLEAFAPLRCIDTFDELLSNEVFLQVKQN